MESSLEIDRRRTSAPLTDSLLPVARARTSRIGLTARMVGALVVAAVVIGLVFALLLSSLGELRSVNRQLQRSERALTYAFAAEKSVVDMETGLRGYLVTKEDDFLTPYRQGREEAPQRLRTLLDQLDDGAQKARVQRVAGDVDRFIAAYAGPLQQQARDGMTRAQEVDAVRDGRSRLNAIRAQFATFVDVEVTRLAKLTRDADDQAQQARTAGIVGGGIVVLIVLVFCGLVAARVTRPLRRIAEGARARAVGDMDARVPTTGAGEVGEVGRAFNEMADARQIAEEELRRLSAEHAALVEGLFAQTPVGLAFVDLELRCVRVNEELAAIDGVPAADHIGRRVGEVVPDPVGPAVAGQLTEVMSSGNPSTVAHEVPVGRGAVRSFDVTCFPVRSTSTAEILGLGTVVVETTSRQRVASEREQLLAAVSAAAARTVRLQQVTAALAAAITPDEVVAVAVRQAREAVDAQAGVVLVLDADGQTLRLARVEGYDDDWAERWRRPDPALEVPLNEAALRGVASYVSSTAEMAERYPDAATETDHSPFDSWATLPLSARGRRLGAFVLSFVEGRAFTGEDRALLEAIAAQCAVALDRAQLFDRERGIASTLQQSLLPPSLPDLPRLELRARYRAAGEGLDVGGDFYDGIDFGNGSALIAIGDVCGKGAGAAAVTGLARHSLRAEAMHSRRPAALLARLNDIVLRNSPDRFCTMAIGLLEPTDDGATFTYGLAGHHPAILVPVGGPPRELPGRGGPVLGIVPGVTAPEHVTELHTGDVVVLHTDGLLDARAPATQLDQQDMLDALVDCPRDADAVLDRLLRLAATGDREPRDDIALIAVRVR